MSFLSVQGVSKSFPSLGALRPILKEISFDVPKGALICIAGPNGSGKTTLLKTLCTLLSPESGTVLLDGMDVHKHPREAKRRLGYASTEDQSFYGRLSARENLWFYAQLFGVSSALFRERLERFSAELDLSDVLEKPFRELSNGQKQRMLLARAVLHEPDLLLLDEPHQNLDPGASRALRRLLREVWPARGKTVLVSTHHLDEAARLSDRWLVISGGRIVFDGSYAAAARARPGSTPEDFFQELTGAPSL